MLSIYVGVCVDGGVFVCVRCEGDGGAVGRKGCVYVWVHVCNVEDVSYWQCLKHVRISFSITSCIMLNISFRLAMHNLVIV